MDQKGQDEVDAAGLAKDAQEELALYVAGPEKKDSTMNGVLDCFFSIFSVLGRDDLKPTNDESWEVPFDMISDLVYLGAGAQGVVFSGMFNGEMVAVKKLRDKAETNFKHLRKLNHENIVRFRGICTEAPSYCVIMEFCQYGPLYDFLHSGGTFAPKQILKWAKEIANGMAYLHTHKIIHRDLKSPNILIADNLVVKVSDFGTSREWHSGSALMSFTGTVAWMAPEIIRHEPCSERIDVWSYGVVLWELLTHEVPYKNLEAHAIMWGVGTDTISLPVPTTCPETLQLLMNQCWNRVPRNRPPFKIIAAHLEVAGDELASLLPEEFGAAQVTWRSEVQQSMDKLYAKGERTLSVSAPPEPTASQRREELRQAREIYEQQLTRANELYMEVCSVRLQLEQREQQLAEREKILRKCRCRDGLRKKFELYQQQRLSSSSSSEPRGLKAALALPLPELHKRRTHKKVVTSQPTKTVVNFTEKKTTPKCETVIVKNENMECNCKEIDNAENNNYQPVKVTPTSENPAETKDTVVEFNGNVEVVTLECRQALQFSESENIIPEAAKV